MQKVRPLLILIVYVGFVSLGLPDSVLGVAWPSMRRTFGLPLDALGSVFLFGTCGYLISSVNSGRILRRIGVGLLLAGSSLLTVVCLLGYAISPSWAFFVALSFASGFAGGAVDAGLNTFAATNLSNRHMNWLHAFWGVGASTGPIIMTAILGIGAGWRWGYGIIAALQTILVAGYFLTLKQWTVPGEEPARVQALPRRDLLRLPAAWLSMALFFFYCGVETITGQWMYSVMIESRSIAPVHAGVWVSLYWGSLTAGRFLIGSLANRVNTVRLVQWAMGGALCGVALLLTRSTTLTFTGLAVTGFSLAPIFPSLMSLTPSRFDARHVPRIIGYQVGCAAIGIAVLPALAGVLARRAGLEMICVLLLALATAMVVLHEMILRRPRDARATATSNTQM
jgi:fucose permease